jgi:hypothetical protein
VATEAKVARKETGGLGLKFRLDDAGQASGRGMVPSLQGIIKTSGIAAHLPSGQQPVARASVRPEPGHGAEVALGDNMFKI